MTWQEFVTTLTADDRARLDGALRFALESVCAIGEVVRQNGEGDDAREEMLNALEHIMAITLILGVRPS